MDIEKEILPDNPAARLLAILERILEVEYKADELSNIVWARVFNISTKPEVLFTHYSQLFLLINESFQKVVEYYPKQVNTHNNWKNHISETFQRCSPFHHGWKQVVDGLNKGNHIEMVQVAADNLAHYVVPTRVNGLTLDELNEQLSNLMAEIDESNSLTEYLKKYLKEELNNIARYVENFDLYGSVPIKKSIYNILSNNEMAKKNGSKVVKGVGAFLVCVATAIGVVNDVSDVPDSIESLKNRFLISYESEKSLEDDTNEKTVAVE